MLTTLPAPFVGSWFPGRGRVNMIDPNKQYVSFGWAHFGAIRLPCIERGKRLRLLARKLADTYLLSQFPQILNEPLFTKTTYYRLTTPEAELLTQLCRDGMRAQLRFTSSDLALSLDEFRRAFDCFRQRFPEARISNKMSDSVERAPVCSPDWILVRDSILPCVRRDGDLLLPLNVLRGAPQVLLDVAVETASATAAEVRRLNELCRNSLLTFTFSDATELVRLSDLRALCPIIRIEPLGSNNPLLALKASTRQACNAKPDTEKRAPSADVSRQADERCLGTSKCDDAPKSSDTAQSTTDNGLTKSASADDDASHQDQIVLPDFCPPPLLPIDDVKDVNGLSHFKPSTISCWPDVNVVESKDQDSTPENVHEHLDSTKGKLTSANEDKPIVEKSAEGCGKVEIVQVECFKRRLTCITRGKLRARYALVESVMHLYFPQCSLEEFIRYLDHELSVTLHTLKKREEQALIKFYGIPTDRLHANLIIRLKDFVHRAAWLQNRFGDMDVPDAAKPAPVSPIRIQKNKKMATTYSKIARKRNVGVKGQYKDGTPKMTVPQYPNIMFAWNSQRRLDTIGSEMINKNNSSGEDVNHLKTDVPYCSQMPQLNWTSPSQAWAPMVNAGNPVVAPAADTMTLPIYSMSGVPNFGFQQIPNDETKAPADIQRMVNREFAMRYLRPQAPHVHNPTRNVPNNPAANWTSNKRAHSPDSFTSKRKQLDLPGLRYPVHQIWPEGSSPLYKFS